MERIDPPLRSLEYWNDGMLEEWVFNESVPIFHYSTTPSFQPLRCIEDDEKFGLLVTQIAKLMGDA